MKKRYPERDENGGGSITVRVVNLALHELPRRLVEEEERNTLLARLLEKHGVEIASMRLSYIVLR